MTVLILMMSISNLATSGVTLNVEIKEALVMSYMGSSFQQDLVCVGHTVTQPDPVERNFLTW